MLSPPTFDRGQPLTAAQLNQLKDMIVSSIIPGPGISIRRVGSNIVIELADGNRQIIPR